jgi:hypothetical protein
MLHLTLITPHPQSPTYLLACGHTWHRTVLDPVAPTDVMSVMAGQTIDLIMLTTLNEYTLASAEWLHRHASAPILAPESFKETALPVARYLGDGEVVGLGPLAQTLWLPHGQIMAYALGSEQVLLTGPLFATGSLSHKDNRSALNTLKALPEDMAVFGGGTHDRPLNELLRAGQAG